MFAKGPPEVMEKCRDPPGKVAGRTHDYACPEPPGGSWSAIVCALNTTFPGGRDLSMTTGRPLARFWRPYRSLLKGVRGPFRDFFGTGQKRKRARKVVKSHRIGTKIRRGEAAWIRIRIFGVRGPGGAEKGPKKAEKRFPENPKNHCFFKISKNKKKRS